MSKSLKSRRWRIRRARQVRRVVERAKAKSVVVQYEDEDLLGEKYPPGDVD